MSTSSVELIDNDEFFAACKIACGLFAIEGTVSEIVGYGEGHINRTYLVRTDKKRYILQKINNRVFSNVDALMNNICTVTAYLRERGVETLRVVPSKDNKSYITVQGLYWRMYDFIENTVTYQKVEDERTFECVGKTFGMFQNVLKDFDPSVLVETIPNFHDTPKRYDRFIRALDADVCNRAKYCAGAIEYIIACRTTLDKIMTGLASGKIPYRVTHNDTKLNNILIDSSSGEARAVIDLDTVMQGSLLYDFGDAIRFGASTASEDEQDLDKVCLDLNMYKAFAKGFLSEVKNDLTECEFELLPYSAYLMTIECGIRFLTDYLEGDGYFAIKYDEHNLVRARNQFKLASDIYGNFGALSDID